MKQQTELILTELLQRYPSLNEQSGNIKTAFGILKDALLKGKTLFTCGNGGSDSDARHIVGELRKRFRLPRPIGEEVTKKLLQNGEDGAYLAGHLEGAFSAFCLNENSALISAYGNDVAPDAGPAQSLFGVAKEGDVVMCISTSGNSRNCVLVATLARALGLKVISLTGKKASKLSSLSDVTVAVPETETFKVQELHLPVYHCLCAMLEQERF